MDAAHIRNFSIIAHIDHGKTTLSDRLLHMTGTIATRDMSEQLLDAMDLEKERGITIKAHPVTMLYTAKNGETYELNLIDTPGHVDFAYEVSRSLSACEGALLVIDAAQGVEAQTVANYHLAAKLNLTIIPVINKIDLGHADVPQAKRQLEDVLAIPAEWAIPCSAKQGIGIQEILEAIIERVPPPKPTGEPSLQALAFDSYFDTYKGVVTHVRVFNGELKAGQQVKLLHSGKNVVERNHFHSSGIDRIEAEQDLAVPGCLDSSSILAAIVDTLPERIGQQDTLICWKLGCDLSDFLKGVRHVEIVARNSIELPFS